MYSPVSYFFLLDFLGFALVSVVTTGASSLRFITIAPSAVLVATLVSYLGAASSVFLAAIVFILRAGCASPTVIVPSLCLIASGFGATGGTTFTGSAFGGTDTMNG